MNFYFRGHYYDYFLTIYRANIDKTKHYLWDTLYQTTKLPNCAGKTGGNGWSVAHGTGNLEFWHNFLHIWPSSCRCKFQGWFLYFKILQFKAGSWVVESFQAHLSQGYYKDICLILVSVSGTVQSVPVPS